MTCPRTAHAQPSGWLLSTLLLTLLLTGACGQNEGSGQPTGATCDPSVRYAAHIRPLMERYCVSCHASSLPLAQRHGAPGDHDFDTEQGILDNAEHVEHAAAAGPDASNHDMPPSGWPQPSDAERRLLGQWLACQNEHDHSGHEH
jgi:uncharacterized membrane protein